MNRTRKRTAAANLVRQKVKDGTLQPGTIVSGAALARETGFGATTCLAALRLLEADGTLTPRVGQTASLRVAAPAASRAASCELKAELAETLAARRRARGLTQAELAAETGMSRTAVGHAETGRLWQSRGFWLVTDQALGNRGDLTRLYDELQAAEAAEAAAAARHAAPGRFSGVGAHSWFTRLDEINAACEGDAPPEPRNVKETALVLDRITLITGSQGKAAEFAAMLGIEVTATKAGLTEIQALDVAKVAARKAADAYALLGEPVLADDTGLSIDGWNGLPGALVAWFIDTVGAEGILTMAAGLASRRATATTALGYADAGGVRVFQGAVNGSIATGLRGTSGFGFDPIFIPDGDSRTFAEMTSEEKNKVSHRGRAVEAMKLGLGLA